MKRTDRMTELIVLLLFIALLLYAGAYAVRRLDRAVRTAPAVAAELSRGGTAEGILVRRELLLEGGGPDDIDITAREGAKTAAGAPLAALRSPARTENGTRDAEGGLLRAPVSGVFSARTDGFEHLTPELLTDLTPVGSDALADSARPVPDGVWGKLVTDFRWYFAAVMAAEDTASLQPGQSAELDFGAAGAERIPAEVQSVSAPGDGRVAVVFRCESALVATLGLRQVSARAVFGTLTGLRIPAEAVQTDPDTGDAYVWVVTALRLERKNITVLAAEGESALVIGDGSPGTLREGNTLVVRGRDLYEGKVMEAYG